MIERTRRTNVVANTTNPYNKPSRGKGKKTGKRPSVARSACDRCRRAKTKCDRPEMNQSTVVYRCRSCEVKGLECTMKEGSPAPDPPVAGNPTTVSAPREVIEEESAEIDIDTAAILLGLGNQNDQT